MIKSNSTDYGCVRINNTVKSVEIQQNSTDALVQIRGQVTEHLDMRENHGEVDIYRSDFPYDLWIGRQCGEVRCNDYNVYGWSIDCPLDWIEHTGPCS